jgi:hypothetical protein
MKLWHAPTGKLVRGHVLDVSLKPFLRALKDYDKQLYVEWNPRKLRGEGCWEIRRLPNQKTAVYQGSLGGLNFYKILYLESRLTHHVLDCAFLNYDVLRKLQDIDMYRIIKGSGYASLDDLIESRTKEAQEAKRAEASHNLKYAIRQNKSAMSNFYEMVRSGIHPAQVLNSMKWVHKS